MLSNQTKNETGGDSRVRGRVLSIILAIAILGALGTLGYFVANPVGKPSTDFYILGLSGKATDYPEKLAVGEKGEVIAGIINREHEPVTYRIEVAIDGVKKNEAGPVTLDHSKKWEGIVSFTPDRAGGKQKIEFLFYREGQNEVYQRLHLWVDVQ